MNVVSIPFILTLRGHSKALTEKPETQRGTQIVM